MACPEGLEPPTYCLEGNCSIQLSYGQAWLEGRAFEVRDHTRAAAAGPAHTARMTSPPGCFAVITESPPSRALSAAKAYSFDTCPIA